MSDTDEFKALKKQYHEQGGMVLNTAIKYYSKKKTKNEPLREKLAEFKKQIFESIEDNSEDATNTDNTEFYEDDQDEHLDAKPDFDKMVDEDDDEDAAEKEEDEE